MRSKSTETKTLNVEGMTCNNCAMGISHSLKKQGLNNVEVNFSLGTVRFPPDEDLTEEEVRRTIRQLGYVLSDEKPADGKNQGNGLSLNRMLLISALLTLPLFSSMFLPWALLQNPYVQLVLAGPVYLMGLFHFGKSAWGSLKNGVPNMDVLVTLGSTAAFGYSLTGTVLALGPEYQFYETAATIITLILLGNYIEHRSIKRTTAAIDALQDLQVKQAKRLNADGNVQQTPVDELMVADTVLVNTGDTVPVDGEVMEGQASVDESMLSGESIPVDKSGGDNITGGTLLQEGNVKMMVTAVGTQTVLSKLIDLVRQAQAQQPRIQRLGDKVSAVFVPAIVGIALITFLVSLLGLSLPLRESLLRGIAVLVVACPCAMGLATPTAVMVGIGRGARQGILIKSGQALERMATARHIVFDKTGTLTTGEFQLKNISLYDGEDAARVRSIVATLEQRSSHPIAQSLSKALSDAPSETLEAVEEAKGRGMEGRDQKGHNWMLGSARILANAPSHTQHALYLTRDKALMAGIDIEDEARPDAASAVSYFNQQGLNTHLLSGDTEEKCRQLARQLQLQSVNAQQSPEQKLRKIEALSSEGGVVMVGDGINDGPSLSRADVGVSLKGGSDVAVQSADVVLMKNELGKLEMAHWLSKHTLLTIKQNLFWAFAYNIVAIPLAATGYLNPMVAALSMAFSDVMVIGNSIRLRYKQKH